MGAQMRSKAFLIAALLGLAINGAHTQSISAGNGNQINGNTVGNNNNNNNNNNQYGGNGGGDPVLTDFEGKTFEFFGKPNQHYALYSDAAHQVTMGLFKGHVDGHDGTYMDKFGVAYNQLRVLISLADQKGDILVQSWNKERFAEAAMFTSGKAKSRVLHSSEEESMNIYTEPYRAHTGRTVNISTGIVEFSVWSTPAGVVDGEGEQQPAYLNFNISLLAPPVGGEVEGIIGESMNRITADPESRRQHREAVSNDDEVTKTRVPNPTKASEDSYAISSIFGTDFAFNKFSSLPSSEPLTRRALTESPFGMLQFPFTGTSLE